MGKVKYVVLDMGKVLVGPTTGHWYVTPVFMKNVDLDKIDKKALLSVMDKYNPILDAKIINLDEEYDAVYKFYKMCFEGVGYEIPEQNLKNIVDDFVYNTSDSKYSMYADVPTQLERLSKEYTVIMLSDNWPCAIEYLKKHNIYDYFDKVYISSVYGEKKCEGKFFDRPIDDFNIEPGEALFVDDNPNLLEIASKKGYQVALMDRANEVKESKFRIVHCLAEIDRAIEVDDIDI